MTLSSKEIAGLSDFLQKLCSEEKIKLGTNFSKNSWYDPTKLSIQVETEFNLQNLFNKLIGRIKFTTENQIYSLAHELGHHFVQKENIQELTVLNRIRCRYWIYEGLIAPDKEVLVENERLAWVWAEEALKQKGVNLENFNKIKEKSLKSYQSIAEISQYKTLSL